MISFSAGSMPRAAALMPSVTRFLHRIYPGIRMSEPPSRILTKMATTWAALEESSYRRNFWSCHIGGGLPPRPR